MEYNKKFIILGNMNAITYKEVFPLIKDNELWLGCKSLNSDMYFNLTGEYKKEIVETKKEGSAWVRLNGEVYGRLGNACWYTSMEHGRRHIPMDLYKIWSRNASEYQKYDNYDAVEVSKTCDIPAGYDGVMGVPITFLDKYCPEQFEIIGHEHDLNGNGGDGIPEGEFRVDGKGTYKRILIRFR